MKNKNQNTLNNLLKETYKKFLLKILLAALLTFIFIIITFLLINALDFQWACNIAPILYYSIRDLWYSGYFTLYSTILLFLIWTIFVLILLYRMLKKVFSYINAVSDASNKLLDKTVNIIELPDGLEEIQNKMNILKMTSEKTLDWQKKVKKEKMI